MQISPELTALAAEVPPGPGKEWLTEALDCFGVEAYRATILMVWLYALDHLFEYVLAHHLTAFNDALAKHPDQKAVRKVGTIKKIVISSRCLVRNSHRPLPVAHIISPDVRQILIERLGNRNSAAHPVEVKFTRHNVVGFSRKPTSQRHLEISDLSSAGRTVRSSAAVWGLCGESAPFGGWGRSRKHRCPGKKSFRFKSLTDSRDTDPLLMTLLWEQRVAGSNPLSPTIVTEATQSRHCWGC